MKRFVENGIYNTVDGKYNILRLERQHLEGSMEVMRKAFFIDEPVSIACELYKNPDAIKELEKICIHVIAFGVSLVAIEKQTGKVVAAALNHIHVPHDPSGKDYFLKFRDGCATPSAKCLLQYMLDMDDEFNIFDHFGVNTFVEIMFLATLKEHRGHGIAKALFQTTVDLCKRFKSGFDMCLFPGYIMHIFMPKPQLVSALCSSFITQKISRSLGFQNVKFVDYNKWNFNGKRFDEVIGPETKGTSIDCILL